MFDRLVQRLIFRAARKPCRDLKPGDTLILSDGSEHVVEAAQYATDHLIGGGLGFSTAAAFHVIAGPHTFCIHPAMPIRYRRALLHSL